MGVYGVSVVCECVKCDCVMCECGVWCVNARCECARHEVQGMSVVCVGRACVRYEHGV